MQKGMKKTKAAVWGMICCLLLFAFSDLSVSAQTLSSKQMLDLQAFGIVTGDENGDLQLDETVSRAEFCKLLSKLTQVEPAASPSTQQRFADVTDGHWAAGYIEMMVSMGIAGGYPDGNFYPDAPVEYAEAVCMLIRLLGYGPVAEQMGGYPLGYITQAGSLGLVKNISAQAETPITRDVAFTMIYHALDIERLVYTGVDETGSYQLKKGDTFRETLMGYGENELLRLSGVITGTYETWLIKPNTRIEPYQIELDGVILDMGETNAKDYLGQKVDLFVQQDDVTGRYVIRSITPSRDNKVLETGFDDITSLTETKIEYLTPEGQKVRENIAPEPVILYNGLFVRGWSEVDISAMQDGSVRMISNDGSGVFNVVFINEYQSFVVESVRADSDRINFLGDQRFQGQRGVLLKDDENDNLKAVLMDAQGKEMKLEDVKKDDVVSIFASGDGDLLRIYVQSKAFNGTVEEVSSEDGSIMIDGESYDLEKKAYQGNKDISAAMGKEIKVFLNFEGKIAYWKEGEDANNYAAIVELSQGAFEAASVKLVIGDILSDTIEDKEKENDYDSDVPAIAAKNKDVRVYEFAARVRLDDKSYTGTAAVTTIRARMAEDNILGFPVMYKLNAEGKIKEMDTPEKSGTSFDKKYNAYEKTFGGTSGGAFGIQNNTVAICVPDPKKTPVQTDEDYLAAVELNNNQNYQVQGFEFDEDTKSVKLIVITTELNHITSGNITSSSKVGLVYSSSYIAGEDGDQVQVIHLATEDGDKSIQVSTNTSSKSNFKDLRPGQLILYSLDKAGLMDGYSLVEGMDPLPSHRYSQGTEMEIFIGKIQDAVYNEVSEELNRRVDIITMATNTGSQKNYEVQTQSSPPVYIYDQSEKKAYRGTHEDFLASHQLALVYASYSKVKAVVIVK